MFNFFKKRMPYSMVCKITRIEKFYCKEKDRPLEILYFDNCDTPCPNLRNDDFSVGDLVQLFPVKLN